jgi:GMP synthase (glutamine-hydrolysing)
MCEKIILINNQALPNAAFERALRALEVTYDVLHVEAVPEDLDTSPYAGVVLSGTQLSPHTHPDLYRRELGLIRASSRPVLGVCGGHHLLALAFGGVVSRAPVALYGRTEMRLVAADPLFAEVPETVVVFAKHQFRVGVVPDGFAVLARSARNDLVYAMRHPSRPLYGVQFHPEQRVDTYVILRNFLKRVCRRGPAG